MFLFTLKYNYGALYINKYGSWHNTLIRVYGGDHRDVHECQLPLMRINH